MNLKTYATDNDLTLKEAADALNLESSHWNTKVPESLEEVSERLVEEAIQEDIDETSAPEPIKAVAPTPILKVPEASQEDKIKGWGINGGF